MKEWVVLGIEETTDIEAIRQAFDRQSAKHPRDKEPLKWDEIKRAYDIAFDYARSNKAGDKVKHEEIKSEQNLTEFVYKKSEDLKPEEIKPELDKQESVSVASNQKKLDEPVRAEKKTTYRLDERECEYVISKLITNGNTSYCINSLKQYFKAEAVDEYVLRPEFWNAFLSALRASRSGMYMVKGIRIRLLLKSVYSENACRMDTKAKEAYKRLDAYLGKITSIVRKPPSKKEFVNVVKGTLAGIILFLAWIFSVFGEYIPDIISNIIDNKTKQDYYNDYGSVSYERDPYSDNGYSNDVMEYSLPEYDMTSMHFGFLYHLKYSLELDDDAVSWGSDFESEELDIAFPKDSEDYGKKCLLYYSKEDKNMVGVVITTQDAIDDFEPSDSVFFDNYQLEKIEDAIEAATGSYISTVLGTEDWSLELELSSGNSQIPWMEATEQVTYNSYFEGDVQDFIENEMFYRENAIYEYREGLVSEDGILGKVVICLNSPENEEGKSLAQMGECNSGFLADLLPGFTYEIRNTDFDE